MLLRQVASPRNLGVLAAGLAAAAGQQQFSALAEGEEFDDAFPEDVGLSTPPQAAAGGRKRQGPFVGRPEDWRKLADDMFNDQNLIKGVEFGSHLQLLPPPKNTSLAMGVAFASDQFPEQHGVHMQLSTSVAGNQLVGTANPTMGEYRAIWNREILPGLRSNMMAAVTSDGQHDMASCALHYIPGADYSLLGKVKVSAAQPTSLEMQYLQGVNHRLALGASMAYNHKQETKQSVFARWINRTNQDLPPVQGQARQLLQEDCVFAALPWPVLELHYIRRWRSPSPMQFPGSDFAFGSELKMHIANRDAVTKFGVMTTMQTFKFQAAVDSKKRLTAQLSTAMTEATQLKFAVELNHAENTSQFGFSFDFPIL